MTVTAPESTTTKKPADLAEVTVCRVDDVPVGLGRAFEVAGHTIAIFRTRTGRVHAVANTCPHRGGPLADGMLAGDRVVCPFHGFRYELENGGCDQQNTCAIDVYPARVEDKSIVLRVKAKE